MAAWLLISFAAGVVLAIPVWIVRQHTRAAPGLHLTRGFNPRDAVPCEIEPVALSGRLLPRPEHNDEVGG
jgi:hypothetical protein